MSNILTHADVDVHYWRMDDSPIYAEVAQLRSRAQEMALSDEEARRALDFLGGYDPASVHEALNFIARQRAHAIARAVKILEA